MTSRAKKIWSGIIGGSFMMAMIITIILIDTIIPYIPCILGILGVEITICAYHSYIVGSKMTRDEKIVFVSTTIGLWIVAIAALFFFCYLSQMTGIKLFFFGLPG